MRSGISECIIEVTLDEKQRQFKRNAMNEVWRNDESTKGLDGSFVQALFESNSEFDFEGFKL